MGTNNSINLNGAGIAKYDGAGTFSAITVTQHDLLIGAASNGITSVGPSATSGVPVISQGASADPTFGTAVVAGGGTGSTSFNINGPVISSTTTTGALSSITLGSQQLLVGNTSAAPTAKSISVNIQAFTSDGTYTPTAGMIYCIVEAVGAGGGGGGAVTVTTTNTNIAVGSGGGAGSYVRALFTASAISTSKAVSIGTAGTAGANTGGNGGNGGDTTLGSTLVVAKGGGGGNGTATATFTVEVVNGGAGGTGSSASTNTGSSLLGKGENGFPGFGIVQTAGGANSGFGGKGGSTQFGAGGLGGTIQFGTTGQAAGSAGTLGGGGGGGANTLQTSGIGGGAGGPGYLIVTEYVIS